MTKVIQRFEATNSLTDERRVFVLKHIGSATTDYVLYQYTGGEMNKIEEISISREVAPGKREYEARDEAIDLIEFYCGKEWVVSRE